MPKLKRGANAKKIPNWRGTCPLCGRQRVRILWTAMRGKETLTVCKRCSNRVVAV